MEEEPKKGMEYPILILCIVGAFFAFVIASIGGGK